MIIGESDFVTGNYLISGGRETVLILWQLETSRRQELPHLTSAIDNIVVSPSGSSYLIQLADNSAMVLSTSELSPTAYVAGLQSRIVSKERPDAPQIRTTEEYKNRITDGLLYTKFAAAVNPRRSNELLLAVPSSQSWTEPKDKAVPAPHLQSFDIVRGHQIARQAITRNHATSVNVGPEATKLEEPNVILLDITSDGRWLATVEEWAPPLVDLEYLAPDNESRLREQARRREVFLKFWLWDEEAKTWTLQTRINHPHRSFENAESGLTFDLAAHPKRAQFATVGEDCIVRVWKAVPRTRDGTVVVRGGKGEELYTWKCRFSIELEKPTEDLDDEDDDNDSDDNAREDNEESPQTPHLARLCYSQDGSVLVICHHLPGKSQYLGKYYLSNAHTGEIVKTSLSMYSGDLHDVAIVGRYLVILSDMLVVWDLVRYEMVRGFTIPHEKMRPGMKPVAALLAVNQNSTTIAMTLSYMASPAQSARNGKKASRKKDAKGGDEDAVSGKGVMHESEKSHEAQKSGPSFTAVTDVHIFNPDVSAKLVFQHEIPEVVTALLPSPVLKGYVLVDTAAQIHTVNYRPPLPVGYAENGGLHERALGENDTVVDGDASLAAAAATTTTANGNGLASILDKDGTVDASAVLRSKSPGKRQRDGITDDGERMEIDGHDDGLDPTGDADGDADSDAAAADSGAGDNNDVNVPDAITLVRAEHDKPVVRREELAAVLDVAPSHALPPVEELMYGVVRLFSRGGGRGEKRKEQESRRAVGKEGRGGEELKIG